MEEALFNRDIIIIGQQSWDTEIGSNCKDIALEFSRHNRVLYVNSPLDRKTVVGMRKDPKVRKRLDVLNGKQPGLTKIKDNLWTYYPDCILESINWIASDYIFDLLNKINNKRFATSIKKQLKVLQFSNYYLFNDNEMFKGFYLKEYLRPVLSIYYSRDNMVGVEYWRRHGLKLEPELIRKSDLCITNSGYLEEYCSKYNPSSYNVGQGFNLEGYLNLPADPTLDYRHMADRSIGYVGALNSDRLDIALIAFLADQFPEVTFVMVGEEDEVFKGSKLHDLQNVTFLGQRPGDELPLLINSFDICINPQSVNGLTNGNYPRKIDEYLSLGKPIIATRTITMEAFQDFVYLADTKEEYVSFIHKIFSEDQAPLAIKRKQKAFDNSWEKSVGKIYSAINKTSVTK